jgi:hypothetical protein
MSEEAEYHQILHLVLPHGGFREQRTKNCAEYGQIHSGQSLLLLEKLNALDFDTEADLCEKLHEDTEQLYRVCQND